MTCLQLNARDWKLLLGPFMILLELKYSEIWSFFHCQFLIFLYSTFQKIETLESLHNWLLRNWGKLLN